MDIKYLGQVQNPKDGITWLSAPQNKTSVELNRSPKKEHSFSNYIENNSEFRNLVEESVK